MTSSLGIIQSLLQKYTPEVKKKVNQIKTLTNHQVLYNCASENCPESQGHQIKFILSRGADQQSAGYVSPSKWQSSSPVPQQLND